MTYDCHGPTFRSLRNPYTGDAMRVKMLVAPGGRVLLASVGGYSPATAKFDDPRAMYREWNRIDGVYGGRATYGEGVARCAWTGEVLRPVQGSDGKWSYAGGFDPTVFRARDEFLYYATMRNGVAAMDAPTGGRVSAPAERGEVTEGMKRHVDERSGGPDEETLQEAARISKACGTESPTVSMHVAKRRRR